MSIFISLQENKSGNLIRQHPNPFDECTNRLTPDDGKGIQRQNARTSGSKASALIIMCCR